MNRIIILGNGFDLAHELPTSYTHFINNLVDSICHYERPNNSTYKPIILGKKCGNDSKIYHRVDDNGKEDKWIAVKDDRENLKFDLISNPHSKSIFYKSLINEKEKQGYWSDLEDKLCLRCLTKIEI